MTTNASNYMNKVVRVSNSNNVYFIGSVVGRNEEKDTRLTFLWMTMV